MQKIHRRKNQDISKEFICPQNCGKAYGSYAALYTHIKNKHPTAKPPEMKADHIKLKEQTRKSKAEKEKVVSERVENVDYDCKICKQKDCHCEEAIRQSELDLNIMLLSDQTFIKFVHCIGQLYLKDKFMWTRNTQEAYMFLSKQALNEMVRNYNHKYQNENNIDVHLNNKWLQYLSLGSKYWDKKYINELYCGIFTVMAKQNSKELQLFFSNNGHAGQEFQNIHKCIEAKPKEWSELAQLIKIL